MIKDFPEFGSLELSDTEEILNLTKDFLNYSDFSFANLWSRDIALTKRGFSRLNGNLVIRMFKYKTNEEFLSICGSNMPNETTDAVLKLIKTEGSGSPVRLVPEEFMKHLTLPGVTPEEDRNSFDYIYLVEELKALEGGKFKQKRNEISGIVKDHPDILAKELDIKDPSVKKDVSCIFHRWTKDKIEKDDGYQSNETDVFSNLLILSENYDLRLLGVYVKGEMVAFMIYEVRNQDYAIGYFAKTCPTVRGANAYLVQSVAKALSKIGTKYFNYEEDAGLENLRTAKDRFRPVSFLKKFTLKVI